MMRSPFEQLDPPSGGLAQLQARLDDRSKQGVRRTSWVWPVPATVAALLMILALAVAVVKTSMPVAELDSNWNLEAHPAWIALGLGAPRVRSVTVQPADRNDIALMPVVETDQVVIYRIGRRVVESQSAEES